jgi:thioesterase domain-containing protein
VDVIFAGRLNTEKQDSAEAAATPWQPSTLADATDMLSRSWAAGLRGRHPEAHTPYWRLGINVNRALDIVRELWSVTGTELPANLFVEAPTLAQMAARLHDGSGFVPGDTVKMRDGDDHAPLFLFTGGTDLVRHLNYGGSVHGVPLSGMNGRASYSETVEEEAGRAVRLIRGIQPSGPYRLLGYSSGGCVTLEAARLLRRDGEAVDFVGMLDSGLLDHHWPFHVWLFYMIPEAVRAIRKRIFRRRSGGLRAAAPAPANIVPPRRGTRYEFRFRDPDAEAYPYYTPYWRGDVTPRDGLTRAHSVRMWGRYAPAPYDGQVTFFLAQGFNPMSCPPDRYWSKYLSQVEWVPVPGNHITMMIGRHAQRLAEAVENAIT